MFRTYSQGQKEWLINKLNLKTVTVDIKKVKGKKGKSLKSTNNESNEDSEPLTKQDFIYDYKHGWFFGLTKKEPMKGELLYYEWIQKNLNTGFIQLVMENSGHWLQIPAGRSRKRKHMEVGTDDQDINERPRVKFKQGTLNTCLFSSVASALEYCGRSRTARMVQDQALKSSRLLTNEAMIELLTKTINRHEQQHGCSVSTRHYSKGMFDPFSTSSRFPTLAIIKATDGQSDHAITIVDNWIFDGNEDHALPLSMESLHICAPPEFECVLMAVQYIWSKT
jgi:hypothetical protein